MAEDCRLELIAPSTSTKAHTGSAITAAVVGVVLNLAIWFALHTLFRETAPVTLGPIRFDAPVLRSLDPAAFVLSLGAVHAIFVLRWTVLTTLLVMSIAGVALHMVDNAAFNPPSGPRPGCGRSSNV